MASVRILKPTKTAMQSGRANTTRWLLEYDPADAQEADVRHEMLENAMSDLNEREKHILTERRLTDDPKTLEELSQVYGVSRERVRQIEVRAFEKLQKAMMRLAGDKRMLVAA